MRILEQEKSFMTINSLISPVDIDVLNGLRPSSQARPVELSSLLTTAEAQLKEMGVSKANIDLIRGADGRTRWGAGRIPLVVETCKGRFVIKPYDLYNPEREKLVLEAVQGRLAPAVLYFGDKFYAEELINPKEAKTLEQIADSGNLDYAITKGAEAHANLAALNINYNHGHWLDEFHLIGNVVKITDFGTSAFFMKSGSYKVFDGHVDYVRGSGVADYIDEFKPIPLFGSDCAKYEQTRSIIADLDNNPEAIVNLMRVLSKGIDGVKVYIERRDWKRGITQNAWNEAMSLFPSFVESFANSYKAARLLK